MEQILLLRVDPFQKSVVQENKQDVVKMFSLVKIVSVSSLIPKSEKKAHHYENMPIQIY